MGNSASNTNQTPPPSPQPPVIHKRKETVSPGSSYTAAATTVSPGSSYTAAATTVSRGSSYTAAATTVSPGSSYTAAATTVSPGSSYSTLVFQDQPLTPRPASQEVKHAVNNYLILPAAAARKPQRIMSCQDGISPTKLMVCPQYNGRGCVSEPCRRLHVCFYWATKTCTRTSCKLDHSLNTLHNARLLEACVGRQDFRHIRVSEILIRVSDILKEELQPSSSQEKPQICLYNVLKKCTKKACSRVHSVKNYRWEVRDCREWIQVSYAQSDYLELMYCHPSEECVDLIPLQTHLPNNRNLRRLASLLSKETSWSVDLEAMKLKGDSAVYDIRRLSTASDLISNIPVAMRWLWYWQDDDGSWVPYGEGIVNKFYCVALSDHIEGLLQVRNMSSVTFKVGPHHYVIDSKKLTQTNRTTGRARKIRRRPACSLVSQQSVRFEDLFLPLPTRKKYLKLPVLPLSSEFIFVEDMLKQSLPGVKVTTIHRIQNDHLWKVYQTKKRLLISLYNEDATAIDEQYLFHGTSHNVIDLICEENLDWKLSGTNVGHQYGYGTYFSNLAWLAHQYARDDGTGKRVMLVVLVLVGKMTWGHSEMTFPPINAAAGRTYDTTCDSDTNAEIFVKYNRDEYYPAYVVRYSCDAL